ncbi:MAG: hypothetical protein V1722_03545 [Candidatus Micrarchaeota archaeon]
MQKLWFVVLSLTLVLLYSFTSFVHACPVGQMPNFDGSCIGDPNYRAGQVNTNPGGQQTTSGYTLPSGATADQVQQAYDQHNCRWGGTSGESPSICAAIEAARNQQNSPTSDSSTNAVMPLGTFSSEGLDQQRVDGNKLITEVGSMRSEVSNAVSRLAGTSAYARASQLQIDAIAIYSREYDAAQADANSLGAQFSSCGQCWQSEPGSAGCTCRNNFQRQINIGSYQHFMTAYEAHKSALDQINALPTTPIDAGITGSGTTGSGTGTEVPISDVEFTTPISLIVGGTPTETYTNILNEVQHKFNALNQNIKSKAISDAKTEAKNNYNLPTAPTPQTSEFVFTLGMSPVILGSSAPDSTAWAMAKMAQAIKSGQSFWDAQAEIKALEQAAGLK